MAQKFVYQLQKILEFRERKEDQVKAELAMAIRSRDSEIAALNALGDRRQKAQKVLKIALGSGNMNEVQNANSFIESLQSKIDSQTKTVAKSNETVEQVRKRLTEAAKERKIIETHKEKKAEEWAEEQKKIDNKRLDEMANNIFHAGVRRREADREEETRHQERMDKIKLMKALKAKLKH